MSNKKTPKHFTFSDEDIFEYEYNNPQNKRIERDIWFDEMEKEWIAQKVPRENNTDVIKTYTQIKSTIILKKL